MIRILFFLLIAVVAGQAHAQGGSDDFLNERPGSVSGSIDTGFLDEKDSTSFDPMNELDSVKSSRIEKRIRETKRAKKDYDSRMASECHCVFMVCLEAVRRNDSRTEAEREADEERARRARKQRKSLCWRWFCSVGANSAAVFGIVTSDDGCRGEKIQHDGSGEGFYKQLKTLAAELDKERAIEERLRQQRRAEEQRMRERRIEAKIAAQAAEQERLRQGAEAERRGREAAHLAWCQEAWSQGRSPCVSGQSRPLFHF